MSSTRTFRIGLIGMDIMPPTKTHQSSRPQPPRSSVSSYESYSPASTSITYQATSSSPRSAHACSICNEPQIDVDQLIEHLTIMHPEPSSNTARRYFCGRQSCPRFKSRKDFKRHLTNTASHSHATWRCCCGFECTRKANFRKHYQEMACMPETPFAYVCSCGYSIDSRTGNALAVFERHFNPCGRGARGRPRKQ
ncbi:hypothetical protein F4808DRAFT_326753 [Astrocystis sublimbata]|nr:hypothetical protein F4808DRAFT_326753 [Astrocystis sublimbata]